jgi:hypothetical protein
MIAFWEIFSQSLVASLITTQEFECKAWYLFVGSHKCERSVVCIVGFKVAASKFSHSKSFAIYIVVSLGALVCVNICEEPTFFFLCCLHCEF